MGTDHFDTLVRPLGDGDLDYDILETPDGKPESSGGTPAPYSNCSRYPGFLTAISPYTFRHVSVQLRIQSQ